MLPVVKGIISLEYAFIDMSAEWIGLNCKIKCAFMLQCDHTGVINETYVPCALNECLLETIELIMSIL